MYYTEEPLFDPDIVVEDPLPRVAIGGYSRDEAQAIFGTLQACASALLNRYPFLSFDKLDCLVVANDFRAALGLYEAAGRAFDARFMDYADTALGLTLPTSSGALVFIHPEIIDKLQSVDSVENVSGCRVFLHELCHVYDVDLRKKWLLRRSRSRLDENAVCWEQCSSLWSEYFANRYSHFEGCHESDDWRRLSRVLEGLSLMEPRHAASQLALNFGYALGTLAGMGADLDDAVPDLARQIRAHGLASAWHEARAVTDDLARTGACWQTEYGVLKLSTAVRLIAAACRESLGSPPTDGAGTHRLQTRVR
jgi:hypothetical protein